MEAGELVACLLIVNGFQMECRDHLCGILVICLKNDLACVADPVSVRLACDDLDLRIGCELLVDVLECADAEDDLAICFDNCA